ncbi:MAG TPA: hypothetical protein VEC99_16125, partial [Clostridia bacterium]|nr:hypothetical protein [Clostridia bacterium]
SKVHLKSCRFLQGARPHVGMVLNRAAAQAGMLAPSFGWLDNEPSLAYHLQYASGRSRPAR